MTTTVLAREAERNRTLRRADWRFLLPNPNPQRTLCLSEELLHAAELISPQVLNEADKASCDLAIAIDPDDGALHYIAQALKEGGTLYAEWHMRTAGGLEGVRRTLGTCGFTEIDYYWAYPNPRRAPAAFWLPLTARGALDYFLKWRAGQVRGVRRWARILLFKSWLLAQRTGWLMPLITFARKTDASAQAVSMSTPSGSLGQMVSEWTRPGDRSAAPQKLVRLLLTGGHRSNNKAVVLLFAPHANEPDLAVKMARVSEAARALRRERTVLESLSAHDIQGIPHVLFFRQDDTVMLGETVLKGVPLYSQLTRHTFAPLAYKATDWLIHLAQHRSTAPDNWRQRLIEPVLCHFAADFGQVVEPDALGATEQAICTLDAHSVIPEQRDFSPWNVLLAPQGKLAVLDWESAELCGMAGLDLIYFLTHLAFFVDGVMRTKRFDEAYRALLNPATRTGSVFADCTARYAAHVGLDPAEWSARRALTWMLHSHSEYERLCRDHNSRPTAAQLHTSMFLTLWRAEVEHSSPRARAHYG